MEQHHDLMWVEQVFVVEELSPLRVFNPVRLVLQCVRDDGMHPRCLGDQGSDASQAPCRIVSQSDNVP